MAQPDVTLRVLRKHFRSLLRVRDELGETLVFHFYDPKVLRVYLPTCKPFENRSILGPVAALFCEGDNPGDVLEFARRSETV